MKLHDTITGGAFMALAAIVLVAAQGFPTLPGQPYGPGTFPTLVGVVMFAAGAWLTLAGLRQGLKADRPLFAAPAELGRRGAILRVAAVPAFVIAYVALSGPLGFPLVAPPLLAGLVWLMTRRVLLSIATGVLMSAAIWMLFAQLLRVPLPLGVLTEIIY